MGVPKVPWEGRRTAPHVRIQGDEASMSGANTGFRVGRAASLALVLASLQGLASCGGGGSSDGGGSGGTPPPLPQRVELAVTLSADNGAPSTGPGRVTSQPAGLDCATGTCRASFDAGTTVTLTATPAAGQRFDAWSGACSGSASTCTVALSETRAVGATFATVPPVTRYALALTVNGFGSVASQPAGINCGTQCSANFDDGTAVTLTATPANGSVVGAWSGACSGAASTCTVTMTQARTVGIAFAVQQAAGWGGVLNVSGNGARTDLASFPVRAALDEAGNALAVWYEPNPQPNGPMRLMANRYTPAQGWGTPVEVAPATANRSYLEPKLAIDPASGRAILAWMQRDGSGANLSLWSRAFAIDAGWGPIEAIQAFRATATSGDLQVGIDASGRSIATWVHDPDAAGSQPQRIYANRHLPGSGWGTPASIGSDTGLNANPRIAVAPSGGALVVWGGFGSSLWGSQFLPTTASWTGATEIVKDEGAAADLLGHRLAIAANGDALLAWNNAGANASGGNYAIHVRRFAAGAWQASSVTIAEGTSQLASNADIRPQVAMNAQGAAVVAWWQPSDSVMRAAVAASAGAAWSAAAILRPANVRFITSGALAQLGIDGLGNALVAWTERANNTNHDLYINRYAPATGWEGPSAHESLNGFAENSIVPALAVSERGNAVIAWHQTFDNSENRIVARHFGSGR